MTKKESKKKGYKDPTNRVTKSTVATLVSVLLITGGGCAWLMAKGVEQSKAVEQAPQVKTETPATQMEDNSQLNKITVGEFKNMLRAGEKQVVYIGRPTCPNCVTYRPIQDKVLKELDMKITYFNTDEGRKEDVESMKQIMETLNVSGVPTLALVNNGKVEEIAPESAYTDQTGKALKDWLGKVAPKK